VKTAILVFPGSNCDHDCYHVTRHLLGWETDFVWHKEGELNGFDLVIVPGGFSYGDALRAGAIARYSPVMDALAQHAAAGGYILGICNGFQVLTESHLLPGALVRNGGQKFICHDVHLKVTNNDSFVTSAIDPATPVVFPVAHMEGRYVAEEATLDRLEGEGRVLFRYADLNGEATDAANPNGSARNIAGIISENGRIAGMMPHPERACETELGGVDGLKVFESMASVMAL